MTAFSTETLIRSLKTDTFLQHSPMPMGYVPSLPLLCILNGNLCMKVPFVKYKVTGETDRTLIFPVHYVVTVAIPERLTVGFEDLAYNEAFAQVDFAAPAGMFRHEAIRHLDKTAYRQQLSLLYQCYDKIVGMLTTGAAYTAADEARFVQLLNQLLPPSLRPFYAAIDTAFTNKYLSK